MRKEDTWWCCGVERSVEDRCSCGDKYEEPLYPTINEFKGEHRFLSNFWGSPIRYQDIIFPTVEHFFQAMKTLDINDRRRIAAAPTPGIAKKMGSIRGYKGFKIELRADWEAIKLDVMEYALRVKFCRGSVLRQKLIATCSCKLIEGNYWNDKFWGACLKTGEGSNWLGRLLMKLRQEFISIDTVIYPDKG